jgi:hypothetical protein
MPMKTIQVNGEDYLERYFVGELNGTQEWLHRFLRADSERHLHSHPWHADSTVLCGYYMEQIRRDNGETFVCGKFAEDQNIITPDKIHRVLEVEPNTWTHMRVYPGRESHWYFIDDNGVKTQMDTSPEDWYLSCKPRP